MRRCQVFNISAGVSVPSFAIKPGMSFYAGLRERGEHILEYVFWGVFRSLLWHVPFTINSTLFSYPLRVNGMGGVHPPPMPPGIALKTAAARYAPLRLHLADRAGLTPPVSTCPLAALFVPSMGFPLRGHANVVQKRSWCFYPEDRSWMRTGVLVPWPSRCDILAKGFSAAEWSAWNNRTCRRGLARLKIAEAQASLTGR